MELQRAYETLGLEPGAGAEAVQAAHRRLREDIDARIARATSAVLRRRYREARAELDAARSAALAPQDLGSEPFGLDAVADPHGRSLAILGLAPEASPLDVASAYVSLCEEIEREISTAPTQALRRRCLEARAEIDEAYRLCAAAPLRGEGVLAGDESPDAGQPAPLGYETQMSSETFEGALQAQDDALEEMDDLAEDPLRIAPEEEASPSEAPAPAAAHRRRRRARRALGAFASVMVLACAGTAGWAWWTGFDLYAQVRLWIPRAPDPAFVEARSSAEYLRRRIGEERRDLQKRAQTTEERVASLESALAAAATAAERDTLGEELVQARARHALAADLFELAERHVFGGSDLAVAYGKMELGGELERSGDEERALDAFREAQSRLELTASRLDVAEEALGARSEAAASLDAWGALAAPANLEEPAAVREGRERLAAASASPSARGAGRWPRRVRRPRPARRPSARPGPRPRRAPKPSAWPARRRRQRPGRRPNGWRPTPALAKRRSAEPRCAHASGQRLGPRLAHVPRRRPWSASERRARPTWRRGRRPPPWREPRSSWWRCRGASSCTAATRRWTRSASRTRSPHGRSCCPPSASTGPRCA
jgi:hypothetical protein